MSGDARVSGNARVYGDAWVYGDARVSPIVITGLNYIVTITDKHIKIGCEFHLINEWQDFSDKDILKMYGKSALTFWREHKSAVLSIAAIHEGKQK